VRGSPLDTALARLEGAGRFGIVPGLERTQRLLERLGNPHAGLRGVLVAGTNGKGSVCALVESMARAAGRPTALLAKPHLIHWGERIALDGRPMADEEFAALAAEVLDAADLAPTGSHPTQFEILTAMGFLAAARHAAEIVVCEVGMGGAKDSTNVADLGGCVLTNVALDHREWLGDTVEEIAAEKAGIAKAGNWFVIAASEPARSIAAGRARDAGASVYTLEEGRDWTGRGLARAGVETEVRWPGGALSRLDPAGIRAAPRRSSNPVLLRSPLVGQVQVANLAVAAVTAAMLGIPAKAIVVGAASVRWPGRMQWIEGSPPLLLDGAHNPAAMAALAGEVPHLASGRRVVALFGAMADKQLEEMLPPLRAIATDWVFTSVGGQRAARPSALADLFRGGQAVEPVATALSRARQLAAPDGLVVVCGSLALVGAVLSTSAATGEDPGQVGAAPR
jgi:dihydrofolate synthase/folylpolyglutamate synthase